MNRLVVVSNRVPVPTVEAQAGGLAVALAGLMERRGGLWFGWSGRISPTPCPPARRAMGSVNYCTVDLTPEEHDRYYNGFSNGALWPLLHSMPELLSYDRRDAQVYRQVNERMVQALVPQLRVSDIIWVHDFHLLSVPALLRARGVLAPIGFFLHVPFPSPDVLAALPEAGALIRDMLGADLVGFQTDNDMRNFAASAQRLVGAVRLPGGWLSIGGRRVRLATFPVEIAAREFAETAEQAVQSVATERLRCSLQGQRMILGVDRLDPTKGLPQRLAGYRRLLETREEWRRQITLLQIAPVSRKDVASYRELRGELDHMAGAINSDWGEPEWLPLRMVARAVSRTTMAGYMREARVGLVTPLRDGMNLVAKEYVAAQDPADPGVLVLSRFAGAARQLSAALLVNPHDADEVADALDRALHMQLPERQERWEAMWRAIESKSSLAWGHSFLAALLHASDATTTVAGRTAGGLTAAMAAMPVSPGLISFKEHRRHEAELSVPVPVTLEIHPSKNSLN
jgi:trehalose 6-phosphate synthase